MSKKHFVAAARFIANLNREGKHTEAKACYDMIREIISMCQTNFNKSRFDAACEFPDGTL